MKTITKLIIATIIILSIGFNFYWFANKQLQKKYQEYYNAGVNQAAITVYNSVKQNGEMILKIDKEQMILIEKNE